MRALPASTLLLFALVLVAAGGCGGTSSPSEPGPAAQAGRAVQVAATPVAGVGLRLRNDGDQPIAYAVTERGFLGLLGPCLDPGPACVRLAPGASVVVPYAEIGGYFPGATEAIVYWWHVVPDGAGGYRADEIRSVVVTL